MANTIYLPSDEDTTITIHADDQECSMNILEFDELVIEASDRSKKNGTNWQEEGVQLLKLRHKLSLSINQFRWLYTANRTRIEDVKKKLFVESSPSPK